MEASENATPSIARAAGTVMAAYLVSQLIGLATKVLIARTFNAQMDLDAFVASNRPSEALVTIMAGGILASSFIPIFVKFLVRKDRQSAWKLASGTANTILVILTVLAGLTALFAGPLVKYVLGVGFPTDKQILTVALLRIQTISVVFFGLSGLVIGILNSHQKFLMSALAPAMYQIGQILGILFLAPSMGVYGLAWGVVIGSVLNLLIQVPSLLKLKGQYFPIFGLRDASVVEVFRLMAPRMFGAAVVQLMLIINTLLASRMVGGTVYALAAGFTLMIMAQAAIAQSVATAVMPTFSAQYARNDFDAIRKTLASAIRGVVLLSIPATAGLILLGFSIVKFLYPTQDARMISWALTWYAAGLVFHSVLEVLVRAFYAMHDTKTPVIVGASAMLLSIGLSLAFAPLFGNLGWEPHGGLALAVSVATALEVLTLFFIMRKRLKGIHEVEIGKSVGVALLGSAGMIAALIVWMQALKSQSAAVVTLGGVALGGVVYGLLLIALRVPEIRSLFRSLKLRLAR